MIAWLISLAFFLFAVPRPAFAHSFGQLYTLPIPFWMYLYGAAAALLVSFFVIGYFATGGTKKISYPTIKLSPSLTSLITSSLFLNLAKSASVFLFLLTILTGLFGTQVPTENFNMVFFWVIFVLGLFYLSAAVGNIFALINPWKVILEWQEKLFGEKLTGITNYPKNLGYYPALIFYFLFVWIELFGQAYPAKLSSIIVGYSALTFSGAFIFGKEAWFKYCEFFSVLFRLIGRMSPIEFKNRQLYLRPPVIGLVKYKAEHFSLLLFILFMLSSTAFDGFHTTIPYISFYWQHLNAPLRAIFANSSFMVFRTASLLLSPFIFLMVYLALLTFMKRITGTQKSLGELSLLFAFSLVPIAFVYNFAHYYTLIFTEGSNIASLISDPFGLGWNLLGTSNQVYSIILGANLTWHSQVAVILAGHITGVYLAHMIAVNIFSSREKAIISQFPMLLLMVIYTVTGLWILSQPITSG